MRIFLSFPSELESQADSIAQSLRNCDYDVFFSHDDLPPGDSFDARVESAIESSDFMVFLISPASVTRGRYTLTEMAFARSKWPNPSNRVLPVMITATSLDLVPNYLKAVTILQPEGNTAAETRAAVDRMVQARKKGAQGGTILPFLALSLASAIGSFLAITYAMSVLQFSFVPDNKLKTTILPGIIFGMAVATCDSIFGLKDRFQMALVIAITAVAWIAAFDSAAVTFQALAQYSRPVASDSGASREMPAGTEASSTTPAAAAGAEAREVLIDNPIIGYIVGCVGGAVGGAITILGVLLTNPGFRRIDSIVMCWIAVTAAGAIYGLTPLLSESLLRFLLFSVWQTAFILTMARGFPRGSAELPDWLAKVRLPGALGRGLTSPPR
jgi:hypothetical protein